MPRRIWTFLILAVVMAAGCIRLGIWQLSRLSERRARNRIVEARLAEPIVALTALPSDSTSRMRRASVTGTPDFEHEVILAARSYQGSPGVYVFTPLHVAGRDSAVLVNRGWIYAPDGVSVDLRTWREAATSFAGYAELLPTARRARDGVLRGDSRIARELDYATVSSLLPYPVSRLSLWATSPDTTTPGPQRLVRLPPPALDEGPHLSYAIQWFSFAAIALIGGTAVALRSRTL
jgi:surfeit locus 1 family protein